MFDLKNNDNLKKDSIENAEREKQTYSIIGKFLRRKGLNLYSYCPKENILSLVEIDYSDTITIEVKEGKLIPIDKEAQKSIVDGNKEYFEALNFKTAQNRVNKYLQGKIKNINNLKPFEGDYLSL